MRSFASAWYTLGCNTSLLTSCPSAFPFVTAFYVCWLLSVCGFHFISLHCHCLYLRFRVWVFLHTVLLSLCGTTYVCFAGGGETPVHTKIILSSHNYESTPSDAALDSILDQMWKQGADIAKIATTATDITDCARLLTLLKTSQGSSPTCCNLQPFPAYSVCYHCGTQAACYTIPVLPCFLSHRPSAGTSPLVVWRAK